MNSLTVMYFWFSTVVVPVSDPAAPLPDDMPGITEDGDTGDCGESETGPQPINNGY